MTKYMYNAYYDKQSKSTDYPRSIPRISEHSTCISNRLPKNPDLKIKSKSSLIHTGSDTTLRDKVMSLANDHCCTPKHVTW